MILSVSNVFSTGLMGAGRTTVGRAVARQLDLLFSDSDHKIEAWCGVRVPVIFEHEGEVGFRDRGAHMIDKLTARDGVVIATDGGAVSQAGDRAFLRGRGTMIYLHANPHGLYLRTRHDKNRPLLQTKNPRAKLEELHAIRDPLYRDVVYFVIGTGRSIIAWLVNMVLMQLEVAGIAALPAGSSTSLRVFPQS